MIVAIGARKYAGWSLEGISIENALVAVNLVRRSLRRAEAADPETKFVRARILFRSKNAIFSNVRSGAEIDEIEQTNDGQGNVECTFKFIPESFIKISASEVIELKY